MQTWAIYKWTPSRNMCIYTQFAIIAKMSEHLSFKKVQVHKEYFLACFITVPINVCRICWKIHYAVDNFIALLLLSVFEHNCFSSSAWE